MRNTLKIFIMFFAIACNPDSKQKRSTVEQKENSSKIEPQAPSLTPKQIKDLREYREEQLKNLKEIQEKNQIVAWSESEKFDYKIGEVYTAKVFMTSDALHKPYNVSPIMKFRFEDEKGYPFSKITVKGDTGYVYFIIYDDTLKVGEEKERYWRVNVTLPLPERDTTFTTVRNFFYTR